MDKNETLSTDSAPVPNRRTALVIFATIADTTWRLFVPVLGLTGLGLWYGSHTGASKPVYALAGVLVGAVIGYLLVYLQYKQFNREESK